MKFDKDCGIEQVKLINSRVIVVSNEARGSSLLPVQGLVAVPGLPAIKSEIT